MNSENSKERAFCGTFDGNNKKIINLKINKKIDTVDEYINIAMFSKNYGVIKNLEIVNGNVSVEMKVNKFSGESILCSQNSGEISKCIVSGNLDVISTFSANLGGIVASNEKGGIIKECGNKADISFNLIDYDGQVRLGGIAGVNESDDNIISNCYNTGNIYCKIGRYSWRNLWFL